MTEITIGYAYGQEAPIEAHFKKAGLIPVWDRGKPTLDKPQGNILRKGAFRGGVIGLVKTRSSRVPKRVAEGVFDLGIVGTDVFLDHSLPGISIISKYDHGRKKGEGNSYLELVSCKESDINTLADITPGKIVYTDVPHLMKKFLEEHGIPTANYWQTLPKEEFQRRLIKDNVVGIELTPGGDAQNLQPDEVLGLVTESGSTREDYGLKHVAKVCDIESLLIVNESSLANSRKESLIRGVRIALDNAYIAGETEGLGRVGESLTSVIPKKER